MTLNRCCETITLALATLLAAQYAVAQTPAAIPAGVRVLDSNVARQGYFYAGGQYAGEAGREVMIGQMYVEVWAPRDVKKPYPIVFFHGASSTATTWMQTPDGRRGWAHYFVDQGYIVYLTDQPARGRSVYNAQHQGKQIVGPASGTERNSSATAELGTWPQAKLHTQYPGEGANRGKRGNPVFDAAYGRTVAYLASNVETQTLVQKAGAALLDKIGPLASRSVRLAARRCTAQASARHYRGGTIGPAFSQRHAFERSRAAVGTGRYPHHLRSTGVRREGVAL
jgi:hypothetical protein